MATMRSGRHDAAPLAFSSSSESEEEPVRHHRHPSASLVREPPPFPPTELVDPLLAAEPHSDGSDRHQRKHRARSACACCSKRVAAVSATVVVVVLLLAAAGTYYFGLRHHDHSDQPPTPGPDHPVFNFWNGLTEDKKWYRFIDVNTDVDFVTPVPPERASIDGASAARVHVDWADHRANQLFANPRFLGELDDWVRRWNPNAHTSSGTLDACGWPDKPDGEPQFHKRRDCFYEDFNQGFNNTRLMLARLKGCCSRSPIGRAQPFVFSNDSLYPSPDASLWEANLAIEAMDVEYPPGRSVRKNVLRMTSINADNSVCTDNFCPPMVPGQPPPPGKEACAGCHKLVLSSGVVQTTDLFASGRYDVIAKVPPDSGLVWAIWTFHYEEHIPVDSCSAYQCYRDGFRGSPTFPPEEKWEDCCPLDCCTSLDPHAPRPPHCPSWEQCPCCPYEREGEFRPCCYVDFLSTSCGAANLCGSDDSYEQDERIKHCRDSYHLNHSDPQFIGNKSIASWLQQSNFEEDLEIPGNCMGTSVCGPTALPCPFTNPDGSANYTWCDFNLRKTSGCISRYNTANLNNYILTTNGGTGPAYSNMCVAVFNNETGEPMMLMGDGRFHKYTIDWHTGGDGKDPSVSYYVDDVYLGTNNVFVPTRGARLVIGRWPGGGNKADGKDSDPGWNNYADDWGGVPGDGQFYLSHTYLSEVKITPYDEPGDVMFPMTWDLPTGCELNWVQKVGDRSCHKHWTDDSDPTTLRHYPPAVPNAGRGALFTDSCPVR